MLDFIHLGSPPPLRTHGRSGPASLAYGLSRLDPLMPILDFVHLGLMTSPQGLV